MYQQFVNSFIMYYRVLSNPLYILCMGMMVIPVNCWSGVIFSRKPRQGIPGVIKLQ